MVRITVEDQIDAPIEKVFSFVGDPEKLPEILPNLEEVNNIQEVQNGGYSGRFTFKLMGATMESNFRDTMYNPPNNRKSEIEGDINGTVEYTLRRADDRTELLVMNDFHFPAPDAVGKRFLKREVSSQIENLKDVV